MVKFIIRRAVAGLIAMPVVAGAYVAVVAGLIGLGAGVGFTVEQAWVNGFQIGLAVAIVFAFYPQISKVVDNA